MNFQWKAKTGQYQNGEVLYLNKILIAHINWNSSRARACLDS